MKGDEDLTELDDESTYEKRFYGMNTWEAADAYIASWKGPD